MTAGVWLAVALLLAGLAICAWAGYRMRPLVFVAVTLGGLAANSLWMVAGLQADPLSPHALMAQASLVLYAVVSFGSGWLIGRVRRRFIATRVDEDAPGGQVPKTE